MNPVDWRRIIRECLELLASGEEQLSYEQSVPRVDVTRELVATWFDDSYHPESAAFSECFAPAELVALARFHELYEHLLSELPESQGTVRSWIAAPEWQEVMHEAKSTLRSLAS